MIGDILRSARDVLDQSWTVRALEKVNATLAAEVTHLRAQRDELQRENSRFQQEARDARERARVAERELYEIHAPTKVEPRWTWIEYPDGEYMFGRFDEYGDPVEGQPVMRLCREGDQWLGKIRSRLDGGCPLRLFAPHGLGIEASAVFITATWVNVDELPPGDTVDLGVFSKWKKAAVEAPPVVADVAKWERHELGSWCNLVASSKPGAVLASVFPMVGDPTPYRAVVGNVPFDHETPIGAAAMAEVHLRTSGTLPAGPVDRSALPKVSP